MKKLFAILLYSLVAFSCQKEESQVQIEHNPEQGLTEQQKILKNNLTQTAKLFAQFINEKDVLEELIQISIEERIKDRISFKELAEGHTKGSAFKFAKLTERFRQTCSNAKINGDDLMSYLAENSCYLYIPYPLNWYPAGNPITVAGHPIDNTDTGIGYSISNSEEIQTFIVNEPYANNNSVLLIMPYDDELPIDNEGGSTNLDPIFGTFGSGPNSIHMAYIGYVRLADYCGGPFEGPINLRIKRIEPSWNSITNSPGASEPVELRIRYPRSYAKAAVNNWQCCNGGWFKVNATWDTNWTPEKDRQGILAYDHDWDDAIRKTSISLTYKGVGFTVSFERDVQYEGDFLGKNNQWWRNWFYLTNQNPTPFDEFKYGFTVRSFGSLKFTTPHYTLYY